MITNDIQELLDGGLSDERTAELLHSLSVSPEKREAFRHYLSLQAAMKRDLHASALTTREDAALWNSIVAPVGVTAAPVAGAFYSKWLTGSTVILVAGFIGYLLGSNSLTTNPQVSHQTVHIQQGTNQQSGVKTQTEPQSTSLAVSTASVHDSIIYRDRVVYKDRISYRDRIVYRDRAVAAASHISNAQAVDLNATTSGVADTRVSNTTRAANNQSAPKNGNSDGHQGSPASHSNASAANPTVPLSPNDKSLDAKTLDAKDSKPLTLPAKNDDSVSHNIADNSGKPSPSMQMNSGDVKQHQDSPVAMGEEPVTFSPLAYNGLELALAERVGILAPAPQKIDAPDPNFSYRTVGLSYRFGDGRFSAGGRVGYGTFSAVSVSSQQDNATMIGTTVVGHLQSKERFWLEGLAAYRLPVTSDLGVGLEVSAGGSSALTKASADLLVTYFFTGNIGAQVGAGAGEYWYNIANQSSQLLEGIQTGGVVSEVSSKYRGVTFEGRYGLFIRF